MLRRLLLLSHGSDRMLYTPLLPHLGKAPRDCHICFITTASDLEPNKMYVHNTIQALRSWGFASIKEYDLKGKTIFQLKEDLPQFDLFYVCGGNTFHLLQHVKLSRFDMVFPPLLSHGKMYVGESAGAILAGPTIEPAGWGERDKNLPGITDLTALHLVPFLISPHYKPEQKNELEQAAKKTYHPVAALTDYQGIMGTGHSYRPVGKEEIQTFNEFDWGGTHEA